MNEIITGYDLKFGGSMIVEPVGVYHGKVWAKTVGQPTEVTQPATTQATLDTRGNWEEVVAAAQVRDEQQIKRPLPGPRPELTGNGVHGDRTAWGEYPQTETTRRKVFLGYNPAK